MRYSILITATAVMVSVAAIASADGGASSPGKPSTAAAYRNPKGRPKNSPVIFPKNM